MGYVSREIRVDLRFAIYPLCISDIMYQKSNRPTEIESDPKPPFSLASRGGEGWDGATPFPCVSTI